MRNAVLGFVFATALFVGGTAIAQQDDPGDVTGDVMVADNLATVEMEAIFDLDANGPSYGCSVEMQP